jgi:hypothetical protein
MPYHISQVQQQHQEHQGTIMNSITRRIIKCSIIHRFPTEAISGPARWAQICCLRHQPLVPQSTAGQVLRHLSDLPAALGAEEIDK